MTVAIRPESIVLSPDGAGTADGSNLLRGKVSAASFLGGSARYDVQVGSRVVWVVASAEQVVPAGTAVGLVFSPQSAVVLGA